MLYQLGLECVAESSMLLLVTVAEMKDILILEKCLLVTRHFD